MAKKKVTVPKVVTATPDPEVVHEVYRETGKTEVVETDQPNVPPLVLELAHSVKEEPWTWFIADDHVTIVMQSGKKYRFERE